MSAALAVTTACSGSGKQHGTPAHVTSGPGSKAATADAGLSPAAYRAKLAAASRPLTAALADIPRARALNVLSGRLGIAARAADSAATSLASVSAPQAVRAQHAAIVSALHRFGPELGTLAERARNQELCASSSVLASLARLPGDTSLVGAIRSLAGHGYRFRVNIPRVPAHGTPRPGSGTYLLAGHRSGRGELTIDNGGASDAVLTLAVHGHSRVSVFIRHGAKAKIPGINDGRYDIYYASGADWDATSHMFARSCAFSRFDDPLQFRTTESGGFIQYSSWDISLEPVAGGTAATRKVNPRTYPR